jgi:hypothetical protein
MKNTRDCRSGNDIPDMECIHRMKQNVHQLTPVKSGEIPKFVKPSED